jgi:hypothetical protein
MINFGWRLVVFLAQNQCAPETLLLFSSQDLSSTPYKNLFHHKAWLPEHARSLFIVLSFWRSRKSRMEWTEIMQSSQWRSNATSIVPFQLAEQSCSRPNYHQSTSNTGHGQS